MANYSMDYEYMNNSNTNTLQQPEDGSKLFLLCTFLSSILITVFLSCFEKWADKKPGQRGCCRSRIFPVDLMNTSEARFGYAAAFGSTASSILKLFFRLEISVAIWAKSLVLLGTAVIEGLRYYPLFACLTTDWVFLGSILGFLYSGAMFIYNLQLAINSPAQVNGLFLSFPEIVCFFVLIIIYAYRFTNHAISVWRNSNIKLMQTEKSRRLAADFNVVYVRQLFKKPEILNEDEMENTAGVVNILKQKIAGWMYKNDPTFKYSTRILSVVTVSTICVYKLGTNYIIIANMLIKIKTSLRNNADTYSGNTTDVFAILVAANKPCLIVLVDVLSASIVISFVLASLLTVYSISQILVNYRTNLKEMFKGSYRHLPFNPENRDAHVILSDSLDYAGSHIAYILSGYFIVFLAMFIVGLLVAGFIVLPLTGQLPMGILIYVLNFIPPILMMPILRITKKAFCKWRLLETKASIDQNGEESVKRVLALKNRNCYHNLSYFLFFVYIVLGVIGCMLTIIKSIVLGVYYLARLDRCSLCKGFEKWDRGYMVYLSFLYVESSHRHPVVLVFCDALYEDSKAGRNDVLMTPVIEDRLTAVEESNTGSEILRVTSINFSPKRKWIRNRWLKAYTLLRNPSLVPTDEYMYSKKCKEYIRKTNDTTA